MPFDARMALYCGSMTMRPSLSISAIRIRAVRASSARLLESCASAILCGSYRLRRRCCKMPRPKASKPEEPVKLKVKKGDTVEVISGKSIGLRGEVITAIPKENKVIVKG